MATVGPAFSGVLGSVIVGSCNVKSCYFLDPSMSRPAFSGDPSKPCGTGSRFFHAWRSTYGRRVDTSQSGRAPGLRGGHLVSTRSQRLPRPPADAIKCQSGTGVHWQCARRRRWSLIAARPGAEGWPRKAKNRVEWPTGRGRSESVWKCGTARLLSEKPAIQDIWVQRSCGLKMTWQEVAIFRPQTLQISTELP